MSQCKKWILYIYFSEYLINIMLQFDKRIFQLKKIVNKYFLLRCKLSILNEKVGIWNLGIFIDGKVENIQLGNGYLS